MNTDRSTDPAGLALRRDRYAMLQARVRNYQLLAGVLALTLFIGTSASAYLELTRTVELHVVEVDALGDVRAHGPPRPIDRADERIIRAQLRDWIERARTVSSDARLQKTFVDQAAARTAGQARTALNTFRKARNPFTVALRETVEVRDVSALPLRDTGTWEIQWRELVRSTASGELLRSEKWRALVSFSWRDPAPETVADNPLGFVVETLSWTRLSETEGESP